jgi:hypothetical protein
VNTSSRNTTDPSQAAVACQEVAPDVQHLYWTDHPEQGDICGADRTPIAPPADHWEVELVGGLMAVREPEDCPDCLAIVERQARRAWDAREARNGGERPLFPGDRYSRRVGALVTEQLLAGGGTFQKISDATGISVAKLRNRCGGRTPFTINELVSVAGYLGVHPADLLPPQN